MGKETQSIASLLRQEVEAHRLEFDASQQEAAARLDYAKVANAESLETVDKVQRGNVVLIAAHVGKTRLIDNLTL